MTRLTEKDLEDIEIAFAPNPHPDYPKHGHEIIIPKLIAEIRYLKTEMNRLAHIAREAAE